ncbi:hypothetical protein quinque_016396 [Culex quinquefasciatus]
MSSHGRRIASGHLKPRTFSASQGEQFSSASIKNYAKTFDQIEITCQNLFCPFRRSWNRIPKPCCPRFFNSFTEETPQVARRQRASTRLRQQRRVPGGPTPANDYVGNQSN